MKDNHSTNSLMQQMILMLEKSSAEQRSFEECVHDTQARIRERVKDSKAVSDEYGNSLLAVGNKDVVEKFSNYTFDNDTLNWTLWLALYNDSWVFRRAIDKPAQDEIRTGITIQGDGDFSNVYKVLKQHRDDFIQLLQWGALFGGSIACLMFDNLEDKDYGNPMRYDLLRKSKKMTMYVVDRWYGVAPSTETVTNMANVDYGKPMYYDVTLADGNTIRFHHDYVLRYAHRTAPQFVKRGMLQGWGYAEGAHIINELSRDEKLKASIQSLINKSLIEVIKMDGMRGVFMGADTENQEQLKKRLEMVNWARDYNSLTFLDTNDEYQMNSFSGLAGLADLLQQNMWLISAALEMQGVLFGDLKGGFSTDLQALERYDETINGRCESYLRPIYGKFLSIVFRLNNIDQPVEFTFNSLLVKERAEKQVEDLSTFVDLCNKLLDAGIIDAQQFAKAVRDYTANGSIDFGLDDDAIDKLKDPSVNEDFNLGGNDGKATL